ADGDALKGYQAESELADRPAQAVALLRDRVKPVKAAEVTIVRPLLALLDDPEFIKREEATKKLIKLGEAAVPALRRALKEELSAEQKRRVEQVLTAAAAPTVLSGDSLRQVRAISVLERAATPEAREQLAKLAAGNPEARLTKEAAAASARVSRIPRER